MNLNVISAFSEKLLQSSGSGPFLLLESQLRDHPSSQKSFVAAGVRRMIKARGEEIEVLEGGSRRVFRMNPWQALRQFRQAPGWLFGYLGYDLKNYSEQLYSLNQPLLDVPDLFFFEPELCYRFDQNGLEQISGSRQNLSGETEPKSQGNLLKSIQPMIEKDQYLDCIDTIQHRIMEGDFYELNYTYPSEGRFEGDPFWLYEKMKSINPVPFGAFIHTDEFTACCASPERFLRKRGERVRSEPIKGTAARADNPENDGKKIKELTNLKNRAENLMIVDLVRHDLSKISKTGSVNVSSLYEVQSFGTVHQLISVVESEVEAGTDPVDIIETCFPMGSMTGAPKIEVMRAIDELECYRRGIYSGAIGYFSPDGDFDFNVVIRTALIQDGRVIYPVGGAITSDSKPEEEWEETLVKSRNITRIFSESSEVTK